MQSAWVAFGPAGGAALRMHERRKIRVLCADAHPLYLEGVGTIIKDQRDLILVGTATTAADALIRYREARPDVTLMDLRLPDTDGVSAMIAIRCEFTDARVMMLSTHAGDAEVQRALSAGARGYMLKTSPPAELLTGIRAIFAGRKYIPAEIASHLALSLGFESLSPREIDVLRELAEGHRNRDIGSHLSISEDTVKNHVQRIMEKLGAKDRTQAVAIGIRRGIIYLKR